MIRGIASPEVKPLGTLRVIGDGFVPEGSIDVPRAITELEANMGYSKLSKAEQWTALNHRIMKDWDKILRGNFLLISQNAKKWRLYADGCGVDLRGLTLDYTLPPDLVAGQATIAIFIRSGGMEILQTTWDGLQVTP